MPRGDRTGPMGQGPMTGRGVGYCGGYAGPGYANPGPGRGLGMRWGGGWGRGWGGGRRMRGGFYATGSPYPFDYIPGIPAQDKEWEANFLKVQAERMKEGLNEIEKRLAELEED